MAVDLQAATPDTSVPAAAFLFGADSQAASAPSVYAALDVVTAMLEGLNVYKDSTDVVALRRGTNAQAFRIYNTFTDASNYERATIGYASNVLRINTDRAGTGGYRSIEFQTSGTTRLTISANGPTIAMPAVSFGVANGNCYLSSDAASVLRIDDSSAVSGRGALEFAERTAPAAPVVNRVRIYAEDNGAGKTRLMALFATGAAQQLAIEP